MATLAAGPVRQAVIKKLTEALKPAHLDVINESFMHNVPAGSETHFKVIVVSDAFSKKPLIQRHRLVNETLKEELASGVHALSIQAKTPEQWESNPKISESPNCMGGSKR
eukprot:TCONS_00059344-protein